MENNTPPVTPPPAAPQQPGPVSVSTPPVNTGEGKKGALFFIGGIVVIVLVVFGIYWYLNNQMAPKPEPVATTTPTQPDLESDIDSVQVTDVDAEFTDVDKDLQSL